ncbi:MAG: zinc ABC transporter substrate-binding protein [Chlorobiales bacterium]|nr:zinc ABC transporter substrate-binding protein [Chlorobiales bacterium]
MNSNQVFLKTVILLFAVIVPHLSGEAMGKEVNNRDSVIVPVVTSIVPLSFFVERVGGDYVDVTVMVPPGANPHTYEPTPSQMVALGGAGLFVKAGSGIEFELDWMKKFSALNPDMVVCNASEGFSGIEISTHGHSHGHDHDHDHGHRHGSIDPHFWMSPRNGILAARNIERTLAQVDPLHAAEYAENRKKLEAELDQLTQEISRKLDGMKNRAFMVFHPAWGYFAEEFNLKQIAVEKEGKELTPKTMQEVIRQAKRLGIRVVFVSPAFSSLQAETIAREIGGVIQPVDPLSGDYINNLRQAAEAFAESMR